MIAPDNQQKISVQLWDESGKLIESDISGRKVYVTPGSPTAQISSALKIPSFKPAGETVPLTINKGTTQRGFFYKDSVLGTSTVVATSSGLLTGYLKITIGFPPPPPPPPASVVTKPKQTPKKPAPVIIPPPVEIPTPITTEIKAELTSPVPEIVVVQESAVLAAAEISPPPPFVWLDQVLAWLVSFVSDKIIL